MMKRLAVLGLAALTGFSIHAFGQAGGGTPAPVGGGGTGGGGATTPSVPGGGGTGGAGRTPTPTTTQPQQTQQPTVMMEQSRPVFLSGRVVMEDGTAPTDQVVIERVCNGQPMPEGYADSKGRFSFQLGQNNSTIMDASVGNNDGLGFGGFGSTGTSSRNSTMGGNRQFTERELTGCEIRATLPGYRSDVVPLAGRRLMDHPDLGTFVLRKVGKIEGITQSATSLMAPKDAKKAYEKGVENNKKQKWAEAQKELEKAVGLYPKYAAAWFELGFALQQQRRIDDAQNAYSKSLEADDKFVRPYLQQAAIAVDKKEWQVVADTTAKLIKLNPLDYPQAFFYNSIANYNLKNFEDAEKSAAEVVKLDRQHVMPKAQHILGILMAMRNDLAGGVENLKGYLKYAPLAADVETVKGQLAQMEKILGQTQAAQKQPE